MAYPPPPAYDEAVAMTSSTTNDVKIDLNGKLIKVIEVVENQSTLGDQALWMDDNIVWQSKQPQ